MQIDQWQNSILSAAGFVYDWSWLFQLVRTALLVGTDLLQRTVLGRTVLVQFCSVSSFSSAFCRSAVLQLASGPSCLSCLFALSAGPALLDQSALFPGLLDVGGVSEELHFILYISSSSSMSILALVYKYYFVIPIQWLLSQPMSFPFFPFLLLIPLRWKGRGETPAVWCSVASCWVKPRQKWSVLSNTQPSS